MTTAIRPMTPAQHAGAERRDRLNEARKIEALLRGFLSAVGRDLAADRSGSSHGIQLAAHLQRLLFVQAQIDAADRIAARMAKDAAAREKPAA